MALASALKCPLVGSHPKTVSTAARTVCKDYRKFCFDRVGGPSSINADNWDNKSGSFGLKCFDESRPNIGHFIISAYQGLSKASCHVTSGFASSLELETWHSIGESLLYGLGLPAKVVKEPVIKQTARELRKLLLSANCDLEVYLLSLLQSTDLKKNVTTRKRGALHVGEEGGASQLQEEAISKKARSVHGRKVKEVVEKAGCEALPPLEPLVQRKDADLAKDAMGIQDDVIENEEEPKDEDEIEAEPAVSSPGAKAASKSSSPVPPDRQDCFLKPDSRPPFRYSNRPEDFDRDEASPPSSPTHVTTRSLSQHGDRSEARPGVSSPTSSMKTSSRPPHTPPSKPESGAPKGGKGFLKDALSKLSPNSKQRRVQKACPHCQTLLSIRAMKCSNQTCGKQVESKAAEKRAAVLQKKLAQKTSLKKAWDEVVIAAKRLHTCKSGGARIAVLAMKGGEKVDSVMTFGLGGGMRYVSSKKIQASFTQAMSEEIGEEKRAEKAAAEAAQAAKEAAAAEERQPPSELSAVDGGLKPPEALPTDEGDEAVLPSQVLVSIVDGMQVSEEHKKLLKAGLLKNEFDLTTAKATMASEFALIFPTVPYAKLKALETCLKAY